jgi:hypothetical protein
VTFEQVNEEPPAGAWTERTVVVVEYGPSALDGTSAKTFREASPDGQNLAHAKVVLTDIDGDADSYFVVLHELGHALGLPHASDPAAVMNGSDGDHRYYVATGTHARLTSTDIDGCKQMTASAKRIQANRESAPIDRLRADFLVPRAYAWQTCNCHCLHAVCVPYAPWPGG